MQQQGRTVERILDEIAAEAQGIVTRSELLTATVTPEEIRQRLERGTLIREHRGVYRVGHRAPSTEARYMAAVKACGNGAAIGDLAAAHLLGLIKGRPPAPIVLTRTERRVDGLVARHCRNLDPRDVTIWNGIPVTTAPRTLVDLAGTLAEEDLARAFHEAGVRLGTTPARVEAALARRPTSRGAAKLRRIIHGDVRVTLSRLESRFLSILEQRSLPLPETNRLVGSRHVDCRWPERRLTVELDGYRYHRSRHAWESDRHREREAYARGDEFRRYTYGDVFEDGRLMLAELTELLGPPHSGAARPSARPAAGNTPTI